MPDARNEDRVVGRQDSISHDVTVAPEANDDLPNVRILMGLPTPGRCERARRREWHPMNRGSSDLAWHRSWQFVSGAPRLDPGLNVLRRNSRAGPLEFVQTPEVLFDIRPSTSTSESSKTTASATTAAASLPFSAARALSRASVSGSRSNVRRTVATGSPLIIEEAPQLP